MSPKYLRILLYVSRYTQEYLYTKVSLDIPMSNTTLKEEQEQKQLSDKAQSNLSDLDLTLTTTSAYFKPKPEKPM